MRRIVLKDEVATQLKIPGMYYDGGRYYNWDMNIHGFGTFIWLSDKPVANLMRKNPAVFECCCSRRQNSAIYGRCPDRH